MTIEQLTKTGLTQEQAKQVLELHASTLAEAIKDFVTKKSYDELETQNNQNKEALAERDKQLDELKTNGGNAKELQQKLEEAIVKNKADAEAKNKEFALYKKNNALNLALLKAGAKNPKSVMALLDLEKISLDGENILGLVEQLEKIKETDQYLFDMSPNLSGYETKSGTAATQNTQNNPFKKETFNLTKQAKLYKEDPELAKKLATQAGNIPSWMK